VTNGATVDIMRSVQDLLNVDEECQRHGLQVMTNATRVEDGWTFVIVGPTNGGGIWAAELTRMLGRVERLAREKVDPQLVLLPVGDAD